MFTLFRASRKTSLRQFSLLLLAFYLLGGHAAAHGLSWCLAADDHSHLELSSGACADPPAAADCDADDCAPVFGATGDHAGHQPECQHLPISAPHRASVGQNVTSHEEVASAAPAPVLTAVGGSAAVVLPPRWQTELLPPPQTLAALRTIVLTC